MFVALLGFYSFSEMKIQGEGRKDNTIFMVFGENGPKTPIPAKTVSVTTWW
jgi:hypothetical protein